MDKTEMKAEAKRLRSAVTEMFGIEVSTAQSLELYAKMKNYPNWDAACACEQRSVGRDEQKELVVTLYRRTENGKVGGFSGVELIRCSRHTIAEAIEKLLKLYGYSKGQVVCQIAADGLLASLTPVWDEQVHGFETHPFQLEITSYGAELTDELLKFALGDRIKEVMLLKLPSSPVAGEVRDVAVCNMLVRSSTTNPPQITGWDTDKPVMYWTVPAGQPKSLLHELTPEELVAMKAWADEQKTFPCSGADLMRWPGWGGVLERKMAGKVKEGAASRLIVDEAYLLHEEADLPGPLLTPERNSINPFQNLKKLKPDFIMELLVRIAGGDIAADIQAKARGVSLAVAEGKAEVTLLNLVEAFDQVAELKDFAAKLRKFGLPGNYGKVFEASPKERDEQMLFATSPLEAFKSASPEEAATVFQNVNQAMRLRLTFPVPMGETQDQEACEILLRQSGKQD
ncbi:glyoxalase superfamily protein [Chromobacterium haemolyticum]|uniref:glyoxalase superfamily protein n=1 Tax=Chromobacterium haemolyticum TaxID=394935 RepID=UPI00244A9581|nr:glyoxalase superfamily protein [Chromobacterium haemolyticum]MDH0341978.1 glyoxalase superfamily protein [Chromobacterium haemolyticum]